MLKENSDTNSELITDPAFLADDQVAYIKLVSSEDLHLLVPDAPAVQPGLRLWALINGLGHTMLVTDSREAALASAYQNDLTPVTLH